MKADFYIGLGDDARWIATIYGGGHPLEVARVHDLFNSSGDIDDYTEQTYYQMVGSIVEDAHDRDESVRWAENGDQWPHEHQTSAGTDYAYAWNNGCIHVFDLGYMVAQHYPNGARRPSVFPQMLRKHPKNPRARVTSPEEGG